MGWGVSPPQIHMPKPTAKAMAFGDESLRRLQGLDEVVKAPLPPWDWCLFKKKAESLLPLFHHPLASRKGCVRTQQDGGHLPWPCWYFNLGLPVSRTIRNKFLLLKWYFVMAGWAKTSSAPIIPYTAYLTLYYLGLHPPLNNNFGYPISNYCLLYFQLTPFSAVIPQTLRPIVHKSIAFSLSGLVFSPYSFLATNQMSIVCHYIITLLDKSGLLPFPSLYCSSKTQPQLNSTLWAYASPALKKRNMEGVKSHHLSLWIFLHKSQVGIKCYQEILLHFPSPGTFLLSQATITHLFPLFEDQTLTPLLTPN